MIKELGLVAIGAIALTMTLIGTSEEAEAAAYLKMGDIKGETTEKNHSEWIDVLSFSHSMENAVSSSSSGGSRSVGKAFLTDLVITKTLDKSSPLIAKSLTSGSNIPSVEIHLTNGVGVIYLKYELVNVIISSYSMSGVGGSGVYPTESISLNYQKIKMTYSEISSSGQKGDIVFGWDVIENKSYQ